MKLASISLLLWFFGWLYLWVVVWAGVDIWGWVKKAVVKPLIGKFKAEPGQGGKTTQ